MTDWQITAKTIFCEAVDDEVTVIVHSNGAVNCTGCRKYDQPNDMTRILVKEKTRKIKRAVKCEGESCPRVTGYKNQIQTEN
jgi:TATA-box binding protein (TBP) (component of TFIID and TFIIIB)